MNDREDFLRRCGLIPDDNGTFLRRLRIWNVKNHFAITWAIWITMIVIVIVWTLSRT